MRRSLTAVISADVVGYSQLMGEDAEGTLATLRRLRTEILLPIVAARRGRVVKSMGDGWIVTFNSVSDAVECAMQAQDRLKIDGEMLLRTGVHIGDLAEEDGDVFGEGVNVAARLQDIADPGSVALSDAVYSLLDGTLRPSFDYAGERELKNIALPVRVWSRGGDVAGQARALEASGFPNLTIRPVQTADTRPELRDLASALTGDLGFNLDSFRYVAATVSEAPNGQGYDLTTNLRASGSRLRLETQLRAPDGSLLASIKINGELDDIFDWQDDAAAQASGAILRSILTAETKAADAIPEDHRTAQHWMFLALERHAMDAQSFIYALDCFKRAEQLEPQNGFFHAQALLQLMTALSIGYGPMLGDHSDRFGELAAKVDELEPTFSPSRILLAFAQLIAAEGDASSVISDIRALTRQLPFDPELLVWVGWLYLYLGEPGNAMESLKRVNPTILPSIYETAYLCAFGFAQVQMGRFEQALPPLEKAIAQCPGYLSPISFLASACGHLGRMTEAGAYIDRIREVFPDWSSSTEAETTGFADTPYTQRYVEGLRLAGLPE